MDYSATILQDDLMLSHQDQDALRTTMSTYTTDVSYDPYNVGISKAPAAPLISQSYTSDYRAWPPNEWDALLEASQSSTSSAYSLNDPPSDAISLNDQSSSTSSDEEGSTHNLEPSSGNTGIFQPKCFSRTSEDAYTQPFDSDHAFLDDYSTNSSAGSLPLQQARNCIDPRFLYSQRSATCKIDGSQSHCTRSRKRQRQLEKTKITQPQDCSTIVDSCTTTRVPLLNPQTLLEARSDHSTSSLRNLMGVYAEISSPSAHQNMETMDAMAALVDASVRELLKRTVDCNPNRWLPPSPAACLAKVGARAVIAKPRDPKKPYVCVCGCGYTSARMIDWKRHMTSNWLASYWQCPLCPKHFPPDRTDKLYGKEGHLATAHLLAGAEVNRDRDYHHNVIDDMFQKHCGFCGHMCNSFGEFAKHVGAHFRDNRASPPYDMRIWKDSWDDDKASSAHDDDDHDNDDENGNDNGHNNGDDNDGDSNEKDDSDHSPENNSSGSQGGSSGGGGMDGSAWHDDHSHDSQQEPSHPNQSSKYPPNGSGAMDTVGMRPPSYSLGPAVSGHDLHFRACKSNGTRRNGNSHAFQGSPPHAARRDVQTEDNLQQPTLREISDRADSRGRAHKSTSQWVLKEKSARDEKWSNFTQWLRGNDRLCWVRGRVGSGKSTLVKYLSASERRQDTTSRSKADSLNLATFLAWLQPKTWKDGNKSSTMARHFLSNDHTAGWNHPVPRALLMQVFAEGQSLENPFSVLLTRRHDSRHDRYDDQEEQIQHNLSFVYQAWTMRRSYVARAGATRTFKPLLIGWKHVGGRTPQGWDNYIRLQLKKLYLSDRPDETLNTSAYPSWCPNFRRGCTCANRYFHPHLDEDTLEKSPICNSNHFDHGNACQCGRYFRQVHPDIQINANRNRSSGESGNHPPVELDEHGINALIPNPEAPGLDRRCRERTWPSLQGMKAVRDPRV